MCIRDRSEKPLNGAADSIWADRASRSFWEGVLRYCRAVPPTRKHKRASRRLCRPVTWPCRR
eukprot:8753569-Alexandrium_andersonii.AAC.1